MTMWALSQECKVSVTFKKKSIDIIHHIKIKSKNHMSISVDVEKSFG